MNDTLHLRIKKEYAAALLEHLKKEDAIEIIEDEVPDIPEWQKEAVRKTLASVLENTEQLLSWDIIKQKYKRSA